MSIDTLLPLFSKRSERPDDDEALRMPADAAARIGGEVLSIAGGRIEVINQKALDDINNQINEVTQELRPLQALCDAKRGDDLRTFTTEQVEPVQRHLRTLLERRAAIKEEMGATSK